MTVSYWQWQCCHIHDVYLGRVEGIQGGRVKGIWVRLEGIKGAGIKGLWH